MPETAQLAYYGAPWAAATVLVDEWLADGREFTPEMTVVEKGLFRTRFTSAEWRRALRLGLSARDHLGFSALLGKFRLTLASDLDAPVGRDERFLSPCDIYRVVDAVSDVSDEDAGIMAYTFATPRSSDRTPERTARAFSFLPQKYVTSTLDQHNVIHKKPNQDLIDQRFDELAREFADIIAEAVELTVTLGHTLNVIQTERAGGHTAFKRSYDGDSAESSVLALSECAMTDYITTLVGRDDYDDSALVCTLENKLTGREIIVKNLAATKKKRIPSGGTLSLHGSDLNTNWILSVEDEDDA